MSLKMTKIICTRAIVLMAFAIVFIITSWISFCPLYLPFGIRTRKSDYIQALKWGATIHSLPP